MNTKYIFFSVALVLIFAGFASKFDHQGLAIRLITWGYYLLTVGVITNIIGE